jgi:DNA-3-methyladenine glycosylase II
MARLARRIRPERSATYLTPPKVSAFPRNEPGFEYRTRSFRFSEAGDRVHRAWGPPERPFAVAVEPAGRRWRVLGYGVGPVEARRAAREIFNLDHPIEAFYRQLRADPVLSGTERTNYGLRPPRDASLFESLVHAVVGQQLSVRAADALYRRVEEATGAFLPVDGFELPVVPDPRRLARLGEGGLRALGLSGAKARALGALAGRELAGAFRPARFERWSSAAVVEALDEEPGVGRWTAENAALRGLGRPDLFVAGDLGVRWALAHVWGRETPVEEDEARAWAQRMYPGWGSYATLYLWRRRLLDADRARAGPGVPPKARRRAGTSRSSGAALRTGRARST